MRYILCIFLVALIGCNSANEESVVKIIDISIDNKTSGFESQNVFTDIEIVKLGLVDEKAIGEIQKILEYNEEFYLLESSGISGGRIICINRYGEIQKVLSKQGRGPGEYLYLIDFDINRKTGELFILDNYLRKILVYSNDLVFDRVIPTDEIIPLNLVSYFESTESFLIHKGNGKSIPDYNFHFIEFSLEGKVLNRLFPITETYSQNLGGMWRSWELDNSIHYLPPFSNTIYKIDQTGKSKYIEFSFDVRSIDYEEYMATKNLEHVVYNRKFIEGTTHLIFNFMYNGVVYSNIMDKNTGNNLLIKNERDPTCGCGRLINPICFCNNEIILMAHNLNVNLIMDKIDPERKKVINDHIGIESIDKTQLNEQILILAKIDLK